MFSRSFYFLLSGPFSDRLQGMIKIAPSLLSADFARLGDEVKQLEKAGADMLHFDVMDGHFVPNITFGPALVASVRQLTKLFFDVHLMVENPDQWITPFAGAGADQITVHLETQDLSRLLHKIRSLDKKAGLSIKPGTPVKNLLPYLDKIDWILVMAVEPGFGGQGFIPETIGRLSEIKRMVGKRPIEIAVDGGITPVTAPLAVEAGATVLVAGSTVFGSNKYKKNIKSLRPSKK